MFFQRGFNMQYLKLVALLLASSLMHQSPANAQMTFKERFVHAKDQAVSKVSAWLVFWSGDSLEDQLKRLEYYTKLKEGKRSRRFLKNWDMYIKRWYVWIIDGKMPIKNPDGRITDQKFLDYVVSVEELIKGTPLTQEEKELACHLALEKLEEYRKAKGIQS